jgi:S1-C subfamily serine protease
VTPNARKPHRRVLVPLMVAALGIALGAAGIVLLRPISPGVSPRLAAHAAAPDAVAPGEPLSDAAIRARIEPSVVDVTATLTYDDETASGTGFVVDAGGGLILTNNHVIRDATAVTVTVPSTGQAYPAQIVGVDVTADIAVLRIGGAARLPSAPLGDSDLVRTGLRVLSFGNQAGAGGAPAVAAGVISSTGRTIQADDGASGFSETLHGMLATTARIEPGDSGGPLAGSAGTVVGVDTAAGTGDAATGYAIPINTALAAERQITAGHRGPGITLGTKGFLGVVVGPGGAGSSRAQKPAAERTVAARTPTAPCLPTTGAIRAPAQRARAASGTLVFGVLCDAGAATAGMAPGDVITAAGGQPAASPAALSAIVAGSRPGTKLAVTWMSTSGAVRTALVQVSTAPARLWPTILSAPPGCLQVRDAY